MSDETLDEKLVEVDKKECISDIFQTLKQYNSQMLKLSNAKSKIINFMDEAQMYESLGFKVTYYYSEESKGYTFSYQDKEQAGFKK